MGLFWDVFDTVTRVGACFNVFGEISALGGNIEQCGNPTEADAVIQKRRSQGYTARMVYNPASDTFDVVSRPKR